MIMSNEIFWEELENNISECELCPRLVEWREHIARVKKRAYKDHEYWGKPVPGFGDHKAEIVIVGLAPGAHGSNRTGRMFTGDSSGDFLYRALHAKGFANQPNAVSQNDGLSLMNVYITAACRCAPPGNKPSKSEIHNCMPYLSAELDLLHRKKVIVALGKIAFDTLGELFGIYPRNKFSHGAIYPYLLGQKVWILASYHPSRQNTQTGRLTQEMFAEIWEKAGRLPSKQE
jgi:uracil-DNA glycosylase